MKKLCILSIVAFFLFFVVGDFPAVFSSEQKDLPLRIGLELQEADYNTSFHVLNENLKHLEKLANVEFIRADSLTAGISSEQSIYNVEYFLSQDVDGILFSPTTDQVIPTIRRMCEEAQVYWGIYFRSIEDADIEQFCRESPYYIGNTYENEKEIGYQLAISVLEKGYRNFALLSESKKNNTCRLREEGIQEALMEYPDAQILAEARSMSSAADVQNNIKSMLQAYPELDCVFLVGSTLVGAPHNALAAIRAMRSTSRLSLVTIDFSDSLVEDFHSGILKSSCGIVQLTLDPYYQCLKMINTVKGYPLEETSTSHCIPGLLITSEEQARELSDVIEDRSLLFFSDEYVENTLFKWNNPDLDAELFQQIIDENQLGESSISSGKDSTIVVP